MRVIAGKYRGRPLKALKGQGTRPTVDRVKESMMSAVFSARSGRGFKEATVFDAFAGTGALGIEALSRGAAFVQFADRARAARAVVQDNVRACGIEPSRWALSGMDSFSLADPDKASALAASAPFDLVFLDPPYAEAPERAFALLEGLRQAGRLASDCVAVYEFDKASQSEVDAAALALEWHAASMRSFGTTAVALFRKEQA